MAELANRLWGSQRWRFCAEPDQRFSEICSTVEIPPSVK
jgi:hypothetical protein